MEMHIEQDACFVFYLPRGELLLPPSAIGIRSLAHTRSRPSSYNLFWLYALGVLMCVLSPERVLE